MFSVSVSGYLLPCLFALLLVGPAQSSQGVSAPSARPADDPASTPVDHGGDRPGSDSTGTLVVHVVGLDANKGAVRAALTDADSYENDKDLREATLSIENKRARWTVEAVPFGTYAVRLYHDENDDGELDTNVFGAPKEAYGFSNDARGRFGPPDFEAAAFTLKSDSLSLTITAK